MFGIALDRKSQMALPRQLYQKLAALILENRLQAKAMLPSSREMARQLGVSRNTVTEAYEMLRAEGYITCRQAAACQVRENVTLPVQKTAQTHRAAVLTTETIQLQADFRIGIPDLGCFPFPAWRRLQRQVQRGLKRQDYLYGFPQGYLPLRKEIASWLFRSRGIRVTAEDVFITTGTTQTINLAVDLMVRSKGTFILENPCYFAVINALGKYSAQYRPIDVDAHGLRIDDIAAATGHTITGAYVTPSHQFPIGGVLSANRRVELIRLARQYNFYILEDDYDGEFRYSGSPLTPLYALDTEHVLYMGTFSKSLFPALRIGFVLLPHELRNKWLELRNSSDRQSPTLEQATLSAFLHTGKMDRHIRTMTRVYSQKLATLVSGIRQYFPQTTKIMGENAGIHLALQVPGRHFDQDFRENCARCGIGLSPCRFHAFDEEFYALGREKRTDILLLGYGNIAEEHMNDGLKILAHLVKDLG